MGNNYSIWMMILFPVLGGGIGCYFGKADPQARNRWVDLTMAAEWILQGIMAFWMLFYDSDIEWIFGERLSFSVVFRMDGVCLVLCVVTDLVFWITACFMRESMRQEADSGRFYFFFMCTYSMVLAAFAVKNLLGFVLSVSLAALFLYPMLLLKKEGMGRRNAGIYMFFLIMGIVFSQLGQIVGSLSARVSGDVGDCLMTGWEGSNGLSVIGGLFLFAGFAVFSGLFPVQYLVTRGSACSRMEAAVILNSVVSKAGVYGILLLSVNLFRGSTAYGRLLLVVGLLTTVWGLVLSITSTDIRKILMGVTVTTNGFAVLAVSCMELCGGLEGFAVKGSFYMLPVSACSLLVFYMTALEQVRKRNTYEIKGLIASGKDNPLLAAACLIACASMGGFPKTAGFLIYSSMYQAIRYGLRWRWLTVFYILSWAFFMTSLARIFMKLFVSKKEETLHILTSEDRTESGEVVLVDITRHPYRSGELLLVLVGVLQLVVGIFPDWTVIPLEQSVQSFLERGKSLEIFSYYSRSVWISYVVAAVLSIVFYVNLVHGILLRAVRNKKNKKLQESTSR